MPCTRIYVDPTAALMSQSSKRGFRPSKTVTREHGGAQLIPYNCNTKG